MDRNSLLDTIQRLLALGGSPNEYEARAAMAKAQELMLRHNLSMEEVRASDVAAAGYREEPAWTTHGGMPFEAFKAMAIVEKFFFARIVLSKQQAGPRNFTQAILCFGRPENVAVAKHVLVYLIRLFRDLWKQARAHRRMRGLHARPFYAGVAFGLNEKLLADRERAAEVQAGALVAVTTALDRAFEGRYGDLGSRSVRPVEVHSAAEAEAARLGIEAGRSINLATPLATAAGPRLLSQEARA